MHFVSIKKGNTANPAEVNTSCSFWRSCLLRRGYHS